MPVGYQISRHEHVFHILQVCCSGKGWNYGSIARRCGARPRAVQGSGLAMGRWMPRLRCQMERACGVECRQAVPSGKHVEPIILLWTRMDAGVMYSCVGKSVDLVGSEPIGVRHACT